MVNKGSIGVQGGFKGELWETYIELIRRSIQGHGTEIQKWFKGFSRML